MQGSMTTQRPKEIQEAIDILTKAWAERESLEGKGGTINTILEYIEQLEESTQQCKGQK